MTPAFPVWTIGHGARSLPEFLDLLAAHAIGRVADVRRVPRSRRHPHFGSEHLAHALARAGFDYRHLPDLGGMREPDGSATNAGLGERMFRGYADHMQTPAFDAAIEALLALAQERPTAILCAESAPEHCHRSMIADALLARGVTVHHIVGPGAPVDHTPTSRAWIAGHRVTYPAAQGELPLTP